MLVATEDEVFDENSTRQPDHSFIVQATNGARVGTVLSKCDAHPSKQ